MITRATFRILERQSPLQLTRRYAYAIREAQATADAFCMLVTTCRKADKPLTLSELARTPAYIALVAEAASLRR